MPAYHLIAATNGKPPELEYLMPAFQPAALEEQSDEEIFAAMGRLVAANPNPKHDHDRQPVD